MKEIQFIGGLILVIFLMGCTQPATQGASDSSNGLTTQPALESPEQAQESSSKVSEEIQNVNTDIQDIESILETN